MKVPDRLVYPLLISAVITTITGCQLKLTQKAKAEVFPYSDSVNKGEWILNEKISDEFEADQLDTSKWFIQGTDSVYRSHWIGRAPSQFSTENVRIEEGKLKLETKWEPDFNFSDKLDKTFPDSNKEGRAYENITTAAVICKNNFLYGYMEIKCKAANASITSSFWALGGKSELDVFEFIGNPSHPEKKNTERRFQTNIIDWKKQQDGVERRKWRGKYFLDWRPADAFHVYGCEWDEEYIKLYADGALIQSVTKGALGEDWVLKAPLNIWVDSETFPWVGIPKAEDLPADFEIEYIRVWQKLKNN